MTPASRPHLRALTGARYVAALLVVCFHFVRLEDGPAFINNLLGAGHHGVEFFFILSGFVLAWNYCDDPDRPVHPRAFFRARAARILPVYWFALVLSAPLLVRETIVALSADENGALGIAAIAGVLTPLLGQAWLPFARLVQVWNTPAWSLSVEAFFYLLFPWLATPIARWSIRHALLAVTLSVAALVGFDAVISLLPARGRLFDVGGEWMWTVHPLAQLPLFILGTALARIFMQLAVGLLDRRVFKLGLSLAGLLLVAAVTALFASGLDGELGLLRRATVALLFAGLIFILATGRSWLNVLSLRPLVLLGEASYALYILQAPIKVALQQTYTKLLGLGDPNAPTFDLLLLVSATALSVAVFRWVERPAKAWILGRETAGSTVSRIGRITTS